MLVAALAFVFHNGVVAADLSVTDGCNGHVHASAAQEHAATAHQHASYEHTSCGHAALALSHDHHQASVAHDSTSGKSSKEGCKVSCCGSACTTALLAPPVTLQSGNGVYMTIGFTLLEEMREVIPSGLKRPPRTSPV